MKKHPKLNRYTIDVDNKLSLLDASTFGLLRVFRSKLKLPRKTPVG